MAIDTSSKVAVESDIEKLTLYIILGRLGVSCPSPSILSVGTLCCICRGGGGGKEDKTLD